MEKSGWIVLDGFTSLAEIKELILDIKGKMRVKILAGMDYEADGRTKEGVIPEAAAVLLTSLHVDALGIVCPSEKTRDEIVEKYKKWSPLPLALGEKCGEKTHYSTEMWTKDEGIYRKDFKRRSAVCSSRKVVEISGIRTIGDRINPTGKPKLQQELRDWNMNGVVDLARSQVDAGVDILDINVHIPDVSEAELLTEAVYAVQRNVDAPIQIDSVNSRAVEAALKACDGKPIVNSVSGTKEAMETLLPMVYKYGAAMIGMTIDEEGVPMEAEKRYHIAERIVKNAENYGIEKEDIFIDCLVLPVSTAKTNVRESFRAAKMIREGLGVHTVLGIGNISYGMAKRSVMDKTCLILALEYGIDLPMINPAVPEMMETVACFRLFNGMEQMRR